MHTTIDIKGDGGGGAVFFASVSKVSMTIDYRVLETFMYRSFRFILLFVLGKVVNAIYERHAEICLRSRETKRTICILHLQIV